VIEDPYSQGMPQSIEKFPPSDHAAGVELRCG
jgi:hypothetical protein